MSGIGEERDYFDQPAAPNYIAVESILCYDCHINATAGSPTPDDDPSDWTFSLEPQDIAFGDGPGANQAQNYVGYYELIFGDVPNKAGTVPTPPNDPPVIDPIGGHYWKGVNHTTDIILPPYDWGDKLACSICHDPHDTSATGGNEVFLRTDIDDGDGGSFPLGDNLLASGASRAGQLSGGNGREMCTGCHQYSEDTVPKVLYGVEIPIPPVITTYTAHSSADNTTECTQCHPHNSPDCGSCHGSPPAPAANGYIALDENETPHFRHADAGEYDFDCNECHATFPTGHQNGTYTDVSFSPTRNPSAGPYSPCLNLYCHSRGTRITDTENNSGPSSIAWTAASWSTSDLGCEACHGSSTPRTLGTIDYGAPGYANQTVTVGGEGAKANSHYEHVTVMGFGCPTCHVTVVDDPAPIDNNWVIINESLHVNNINAAGFDFDVVAAENTGPADPWFDSYTWAADGGTCTNIDCHNGQNAQWGDVTVGDNCVLCHVRTNAAGGDNDTWGLPDGTPTLLDEDQWCDTGHGRAEGAICSAVTGWYPWPDNLTSTNPAALACLSSDPTSPTGGCHVSQVDHLQATNPFRLATPDVSGTYQFEYPDDTIDGQSVNLFCAVCHDAADEKEHSEAITEGHGAVNNWPAGDRNAFKCTDCHDPHGDGLDPGVGPDYMVQERVFSDSSDNYGVPNNPGTAIYPAAGLSIDFDIPQAGPKTPGDYVNTTAGQTPYDDKICQVCHTANAYFRRTADPVAHNTGVECMQCHSHDEGFKATACELCHSTQSLYLPLAPIVMGDGTDPVGTTIPFDDGAFGYNVNGHGTKVFDPDGVVGPQLSRYVSCDDCHDISVPVILTNPTHLDGTRDTYDYPGSTFGGPNVNTSHLDESLYFGAVGPEADWQLNFDAVCTSNGQCHLGMSSPPHIHETSHGDGVMRFGDHSTVADPKQVRPGSYWTPWTIEDITTDAPPPVSQYGTCVSCHDPHGGDIRGWSTCPSAPDGNFHMAKENPCDASFFCNSNCHRP